MGNKVNATGNNHTITSVCAKSGEDVERPQMRPLCEQTSEVRSCHLPCFIDCIIRNRRPNTPVTSTQETSFLIWFSSLCSGIDFTNKNANTRNGMARAHALAVTEFGIDAVVAESVRLLAYNRKYTLQ